MGEVDVKQKHEQTDVHNHSTRWGQGCGGSKPRAPGQTRWRHRDGRRLLFDWVVGKGLLATLSREN